jgi:hypothetical protein
MAAIPRRDVPLLKCRITGEARGGGRRRMATRGDHDRVGFMLHEVVDAPNRVAGAFQTDDIFTGGGDR